MLCNFETDEDFPLTCALNKESSSIKWKSAGHFGNKVIF